MQRNYRFFFMFVFSTTLLCIYVFGFCWVYIVRIRDADHSTIWKAMTKTPASIVLILYTFISVWFVGGLTVFHLYLISTNQVTRLFLSLASLHSRNKNCSTFLYLIIQTDLMMALSIEDIYNGLSYQMILMIWFSLIKCRLFGVIIHLHMPDNWIV